MNLFELANLHSPKNSYLVRQDRIKREGSPYYPWIPGIIASTASIEIRVDDQFPDSRKYQPLDWIEVTNNDANDLNLTINTDSVFPVPAGTIRTIQNKALWNIMLTNTGGGNTVAGKIVVSVRKEPLTIDQWARRQT